MGINNIGFYEDLTKNIFQLSSNIIKNTPYLFFCSVYNVETLLGLFTGSSLLTLKISIKSRRIKIKTTMATLKVKMDLSNW